MKLIYLLGESDAEKIVSLAQKGAWGDVLSILEEKKDMLLKKGVHYKYLYYYLHHVTTQL